MCSLRSSVAAFLALSLSAASAAAQITVDRESVALNPASVSERSATMTVSNIGAAPAQLSVKFEDWDVDADGASHWRKGGAVTGSCGNRISVSPAALPLAPGEKRTLVVSVRAAARFDAECWSAVVVHSIIAGSAVTEPSTSESVAIDSSKAISLKTIAARSGRTSIPLYVTPSGLSADGELSNMYVKGDSLEVIYKNTGKVRTNIVGEIQVQTAGDSVVTTMPLDSATVLVGATRRFRVAIPKLPRGKYLLVALIDFGGEQLTAVQAALDIR